MGINAADLCVVFSIVLGKVHHVAECENARWRTAKIVNWILSVLCRTTTVHECVDYTNTHRLTALCPGLPGWASTRKVKPIWIFLKQQTASGSGNSWDIRKSAPRSRQITMPAPHCSVFYRLDALPAAQPTVSKHWSKLYGTKKMILHIHKNNSFRVSKCHIWSKSWTHCHIMLGHMLKLSAA